MNDLAYFLVDDRRAADMHARMLAETTERARTYAMQKHANIFAQGLGHVSSGIGRAASALGSNPAALTAAGGAVIGAGMAGEGNRLGGALAGATVGGGLGHIAGAGGFGQGMQNAMNSATTGVQRFGTNMSAAGTGVVNNATAVVPAGGTAQTFGQMVSSPFKTAFSAGA